MANKRFRNWDVDRTWLLPPSLEDFVPKGHAAVILRDVVRETLDLSAILESYESTRGQPPCHPAMMTALLLHSFLCGIHSSRRIADACRLRVDFMALTGSQQPDFRTISDFRNRHLEAIAGLSNQVLNLCREAGLAKLGHVALDGTRFKANASRHKATSCGRMVEAVPDLEAELAAWLERSKKEDAAEDGKHGDNQGDEGNPSRVADKRKRLARLREAKAVLEAEAAAEAKGGTVSKEAETGAAVAAGSAASAPAVSPPKPKDKARRNFTDPESRILKTRDGFIQGCNAQAAVDAEHQVIVAHGLVAQGSDQDQLAPMIDAIGAATGCLPDELSADSGCCSEKNLELLEDCGIRGHVATGRQKHGTSTAASKRSAPPDSRRAAMTRRLKQGGRRSRYRLRKAVVEPVFGQIKHARGFRQFMLRGLDKTRHEWAIVCTARNLGKLIAVGA